MALFLRHTKLEIVAHKRLYLSVISFMLVLSSLITFSPVHEYLEDNLGRPSLFWARDVLGGAPKLNGQLKIYAFADDAVSKLGKPETLKSEVWKEIIAALSVNQPRAIILDMIFGAPRDTETELHSFQRLLANDVPLATAAFVTNNSIPYRTAIPLAQDKFRISSGSEFSDYYSSRFKSTLVYGPHSELAQSALHIGHINYRSPGWLLPLIPYPPNSFLRHLSLFAGRTIKFEGTHLLVDGKHVPLRSNGETLINWSVPNEYYKHTYSVLDLLENWRQGKAPRLVKKDDVVILLPMMYTGNTDFKRTLVGDLPGGYALVTAANSVLTGRWITTVDTSAWGPALGILLAVLFSITHGSRAVIGLGLGSNALFLGIVVALFSYHEHALTWVTTVGTFNACLISLFIAKSMKHELRSVRINDALTGVISQDLLRKINESSGNFSVRSEEKTITTMFIDFVGFSLTSERIAPDVLFALLKENLTNLSAIIHRHGGIVDKSLGDGLLGFFGYNPVTRETGEQHADAALACATEIQIFMANICCENALNGQPVFPARIGLNTGVAYIGNLGENGRIDLTVIGHSVNMSKRFEDAAEPFKILVGPSTRMYLRDPVKKTSLILRKTIIKHQKTPVEAYELDPFAGNLELYGRALKAYRDWTNLARKADRIMVDPTDRWELWIGDDCRGQVVDVSLTGFCVDLREYFANKVTITFDLKVNSPESSTDTKPFAVYKGLVGTVRWGRQFESRFRHGIELSCESADRIHPLISGERDVA